MEQSASVFATSGVLFSILTWTTCTHFQLRCRILIPIVESNLFFFYSWKGTTFRSTHLLPELIKKKKEWSNLLLFLNNLQELCIDSNTLSDGSGDDVYDHRTIVKSSLKVLSFINDSSETAQISWQMKVKFPELPVVACFMASWILIS